MSIIVLLVQNSIATEVMEEVELVEEVLVDQIKLYVNWRSGQRDSNSQSSQRSSRKTNPLDANGEVSVFFTYKPQSFHISPHFVSNSVINFYTPFLTNHF